MVHETRALTCTEDQCQEVTTGSNIVEAHAVFVPCTETFGAECHICSDGYADTSMQPEES